MGILLTAGPLSVITTDATLLTNARPNPCKGIQVIAPEPIVIRPPRMTRSTGRARLGATAAPGMDVVLDTPGSGAADVSVRYSTGQASGPVCECSA